MTWLNKIVGGLLAIMLTSLIAGAAGLVWLHAHGLQLLSVQSASMVPTFRAGDALIVEPIKTQELKSGQVVSYRNPRNPQMIISHRLIRIDSKTGMLTTAGDALQSHDQPFPARQVMGRAVAVAPRLGRLLNALRRPFGLIMVIYLPAAMLIGYELHKLYQNYATPAIYSLYR